MSETTMSKTTIRDTQPVRVGLYNLPGRDGASWWAFALRGVIAILFGLAAFAWPGLTVEILVYLFGAFVLIDGLFSLIAVVTGRTGGWATLLEGLLGIGLGVASFVWPGVVATSLVIVIAAWAIITGVLEIVAAIRLRRVIEHEWLLGLGGVLSILMGIILALQPGVGALALVWVIGAYAILFGVMMLMLSFRLRTWNSTTGTRATSG